MRLHTAKFFASLITATSLGLSTQVCGSDLSSIYKQALENDHEFRAAEAGYKAGKESKNIQKSKLLPKLNGRATWSDSSTDNSGTSSRPGEVGQVGEVIGTTDNTTETLSISLQQPLFNMAAWHDYKSGKADRNVAEARFKLAQQALIIRSAEAYFDALQAADNLQTSLAEEDALKHQLEQSRQRFEVGLSAITEVHEAQAAYDSSVADRLIAEGQLAINFEALEVLTGQSYDSIASVKDDFTAVSPQPETRESWVERALENNFELTAAKENANARKHGAKSAKSGHFPTLTFDGSYSSGNRDSFTSETSFSDIDSDSHTLSLRLDVPLYNGGSTSASRRQAKQLSIQAREQWLKTQRDVVQAARARHLSVVTSVATVKARKQAIVSAQSALEATQAGYSVGTRDLVDVLNAQRGLYQAERNYYTALYTYILNSLRLKETAGVLGEQDVEQLNAWLDINNPIRKAELN